MGVATSKDELRKRCADGDRQACEMLGYATPLQYRGVQMAKGGLLADSARNWRMEATYPETEKGEARRLTKEAVPMLQREEDFMYSPLKSGYAEGGEVDAFDTTGSMLEPEVPLNFDDDSMMMDDDMMMEEDMMMEQDPDAFVMEDAEVIPEVDIALPPTFGLSLNSVVPNRGIIAGGEEVQIIGTGFTRTTQFKF